jgi:CRP-like cAMP-binding protein
MLARRSAGKAIIARARPLFSPSARPRRLQLPARRKISFGSLPDDGVLLREGSRLAAWHAWLRPRVDQGVLLHGSKVLVLVSCFTLDWTTLRCTLIASSFMSMAFHGLFPAPRPVRMGWGALFAAGHIFSLGMHLRESHEWKLGSAESERLFARVFEPHGWTRWHMKKLLAHGEFVDVAPGELINEEAEPIDHFTILLSGSAEFCYRKDAEMSMPSHRFKQKDRAAWERQKVYTAGAFDGPSFCGEIWDRKYYTEAALRRLKEKWDRDEHLWGSSCIAKTQCRCFRLPKRWLHELLEQNDGMRAAAVEMQVDDLWKTRRGLVKDVNAAKADIHALAEHNAKLNTKLSGVVEQLPDQVYQRLSKRYSALPNPPGRSPPQ